MDQEHSCKPWTVNRLSRDVWSDEERLARKLPQRAMMEQMRYDLNTALLKIERLTEELKQMPLRNGDLEAGPEGSHRAKEADRRVGRWRQQAPAPDLIQFGGAGPGKKLDYVAAVTDLTRADSHLIPLDLPVACGSSIT
jgi:hypothetical protein